jgi:hypothetical protein
MVEGRSVSAPQHQNLERREDAPVQATRHHAVQLRVDKVGDAVRPVLGIGEHRTQQAGAEGDPDKAQASLAIIGCVLRLV